MSITIPMSLEKKEKLELEILHNTISNIILVEITQ